MATLNISIKPSKIKKDKNGSNHYVLLDDKSLQIVHKIKAKTFRSYSEIGNMLIQAAIEHVNLKF